MNSFFGAVLLLLAFCFPGCVLAGEQACQDKSDIELRQQAMWLSGTLEAQRDLIVCIDDAWLYFDTEAQTKSAEFVYYASTSLLSALQFNLSGFVRTMEDRPRLLSKWLHDVRSTAFTWRDDLPCGRQPQIDEVQLLLDAHRDVLGSISSFHAIDSQFEGMRCNIID